MARRWILLAAAAAVAFVIASLVLSQHPRQGTAETIEQPGPLVIAVMPTLSWQDIGPQQTPRLWSMVEDGAVANLGGARHRGAHLLDRRLAHPVRGGAREPRQAADAERSHRRAADLSERGPTDQSW